MKGYNELSENDQKFVQEFSSFVNGKMCSCKETGRALTEDHRYLVNEKMKVMMHFMQKLAEDYHRGWYDQRNEWACQLSAMAIEYLAEIGLYYLPKEYYEINKY